MMTSLFQLTLYLSNSLVDLNINFLPMAHSMAFVPLTTILRSNSNCHDDVIKWKHFPRYWPFVRGIHRFPVNSPHKGQWRGALMIFLICVWINGWASIYRRLTWLYPKFCNVTRTREVHWAVLVCAFFFYQQTYWKENITYLNQIWNSKEISLVGRAPETRFTKAHNPKFILLFRLKNSDDMSSQLLCTAVVTCAK